MAWFKRPKENILPETNKIDVPDGQWIKCADCNEIIHKSHLEQNFYTCSKCGHHFRIDSSEYIKILLDEDSFVETQTKMKAKDPLDFVDTKSYSKRVDDTIKKTGLYDAIRTGTGKMNGMKVALGCMDFAFIGGSMGSVVGEKIYRLVKLAIKEEIPLILISASGGARMMESAFSLMQMAKTSAALTLLSEAKLPYISILTNPTTGGTTASFASLGDVNIAEPKALIGFAGPRVIKQTIGKDLPEGFQSSEFVMEHGFVDKVVPRKDLKNTIYNILSMMK